MWHTGIRTLAMISILWTGPARAARELMLLDDFERKGAAPWVSTWGKAGPSPERARSGKTAIKETLEDKHGLSVWYLDFDAVPGAVYAVSAWVYVPAGQKAVVAPTLAISKTNWKTQATATSPVTDEWVRLELEHKNVSEQRLRLALYQEGQKAGAGGCVMYWDDVTMERELPEIDMSAGIRINPYVSEGLDVLPLGGMKLKIMPGVINVDGAPVSVEQEVVLEIRPPRTIEVRDEPHELTDVVPRLYGQGTPLVHCQSHRITVADTLDPDSLVVKVGPGPDAERYEEGKDWRADKQWAQLGRLPEGRIEADTTVYVDYTFGLMRIDTIEVRSDGKIVVREGNEHRMVPTPPAVDMLARGLCNVYLPYHCKELAEENIYPLGPAFPEPSQVECEAKAALIPKTRRMLTAGEPFTVLFWGDSVTCGGDASSQETAFPLGFTNWLRLQYPQTRIGYVNAGTGGWNSNSKLPLFQEEVIDKKPNLVVIEFVNDMGLDRDGVFRNYTEAVGRIREIGGEVIVLTPHFTRPDWMGAGKNMRTKEVRDAVTYMREFCAENRVGLADACRRWEHLWVEGIPYLTLLYNAINHPDDRGHKLFIDELKSFFRGADPALPDERREFNMPDRQP